MADPDTSAPHPRSEGLGANAFGARFLSKRELARIGEVWEKEGQGDPANQSNKVTVSRLVLGPVASAVASLIPDYVSPNLLTLCALGCACQAMYSTELYRTTHPVSTFVFSVILIGVYQVLSVVDTRHAFDTGQSSPLGHVFKTICDCLSIVFIATCYSRHAGIENTLVRWYIVQGVSLCLLWGRLRAYLGRTRRGLFRLFVGAGELLFLCNCFVAYRILFGLESIQASWMSLVVKYLEPLLMRARLVACGPELGAEAAQRLCNELLPRMQALGKSVPAELTPTYTAEEVLNDPEVAFGIFCQGIHVLLVLKIFAMAIFSVPRKDVATRNTLLFVLLYRSVPTLLHFTGQRTLTTEDVICDGLFIAAVTVDLTIARIAGRGLHNWIVVMAMLSMFDKFLSLFVLSCYFGTIIYDVCQYFNLPLFSQLVNVYVDGVFDLCHMGHKQHIFRAAEYGSRVFVGVMSDEDVEKYKRSPIMTLDQRVAEVNALHCVYKVIPGAPCFGMTEDFIKEHNLHVILCSPEYDKPDDKYYAVPRKLGLLKPLPRTEGVSTSDIIKRVKDKFKGEPLSPVKPKPSTPKAGAAKSPAGTPKGTPKKKGAKPAAKSPAGTPKGTPKKKGAQPKGGDTPKKTPKKK